MKSLMKTLTLHMIVIKLLQSNCYTRCCPIGWHRNVLYIQWITLIRGFSLLNLGPFSQKLRLVNRPY